MKQYRINDMKDYYSQFSSDILLEKKDTYTNQSQYNLCNDIGKGNFELISLDGGIEVCFADMKFKNKLEYEYQLDFNCFEIIYCIKGHMKFNNKKTDTLHTIQKEDIKFIRNSSYGWESFSTSDDWESISIIFNNQFFNQFPELTVDTLDEQALESLINDMMVEITIPDVKVAFNQIHRCNLPKDSTCRILYLQSKAIEIISLILKEMIIKNEPNQNLILKNDDIDKLQYAKEIINNDYVNPLSINELSKHIGLNTFKLKVGFKQIYNTTIYGYIRDLRMEKAREYLIEGQKNVIEIANMVGYSNPSHFSAAFKKKFGVNPSELKRKTG